MARSKYEYVRELERNDRLPNFSWIVVRIDGWHFHRFSEIHGFDKPNDERALNLMNLCAVLMLEQFPDIVFAYGDSDEYRLRVHFIYKINPSIKSSNLVCGLCEQLHVNSSRSSHKFLVLVIFYYFFLVGAVEVGCVDPEN
uniref:Putative tRNA(His) guanylyltransferase n=1 Tax=Anthurium amnicola TaxID=1678845 RepID=A0A1D1Z1G6_9ARAE